MAFIDTTKEETDIFGAPSEPREKTLERKRQWQRRVEAVGRYDDVMKEIGDLPDNEQFDAWVARSGVRQVSAAKG